MCNYNHFVCWLLKSLPPHSGSATIISPPGPIPDTGSIVSHRLVHMTEDYDRVGRYHGWIPLSTSNYTSSTLQRMVKEL